MTLMRQIYQVKNRQVTLTLPKDFSAQRVEVTVTPVEEEKDVQEGKTAVMHSFLSLDTSQFTAEQLRTYEETCARIQKNIADNKPYIDNLFTGLIHISDDFDAPLPDEYLFRGEGTDEYCMTISQ